MCYSFFYRFNKFDRFDSVFFYSFLRFDSFNNFNSFDRFDNYDNVNTIVFDSFYMESLMSLVVCLLSPVSFLFPFTRVSRLLSYVSWRVPKCSKMSFGVFVSKC